MFSKGLVWLHVACWGFDLTILVSSVVVRTGCLLCYVAYLGLCCLLWLVVFVVSVALLGWWALISCLSLVVGFDAGCVSCSVSLGAMLFWVAMIW